ncbi:thioredoxin [Niveibacterium umoris]|uniref:Putative thioredoxin n=1 Tax=Niveibacterium umoris TaxID=1193620 RepID=A0A840BIF1_9RHOO|nr:tetratricopeptide repeat protein [Niveibacterium umoris]MBB4010706.1 putative thioredoxin [Niveibacterium umoris]
MASSAFIFDVTTADFEQRVLAASHHAPVLVDFWAPWCAPCRALGPVLEKLATEFGGKFLLAKVNSDENQALAAKFGVRGIPNVKAVVAGEVVDEFTGALPEATLRAFIESLLPSPAAPLREAARIARDAGRLDEARSLLEQAQDIDPRDEASYFDLIEVLLDQQDLPTARLLIDGAAEPARDVDRLAALRARLALQEGAPDNSERDALEARIAANPGDLGARLALARLLSARRDYEPALAQLIEIVRRDRSFEDDAGRLMMLQLFAAIPDESLVRRYRSELAATLNR